MSYFYFNKDQEKTQSSLICIVENTEDQQYFADPSTVDIVEVSHEDFIKVKTTAYQITGYDGSNFTYFHHDPSKRPAHLPPNDTDATFVQSEIDRLKTAVDKWISENSLHAKVSEWQSYRNFLDTFDVNSISYPLENCLFQYFQDNSIDYKNLLELPLK